MSYISFQPKDYFNTKLYSGTGAIQTVSGVGFEPSWIWTKSRTNAGNNKVTDQVRGLTKYVRTNGTNAEETHTDSITAVNNDGFVLGADSTNDFNANGQNYVSWNWKANGQGSSNTDGSINTTYTSVNTTSGFSISTYSGTGSAATIGHGLGVVPQVMIVKNTYQAEHWIVYHHKIDTAPQDKYIRLNDTGSRADFPMWNDTAPTASVFSVGTSTSVNQAGGTFVAYCFAEKKGFSKFGSYTGNGNTNGTFVYTGFKPAMIMFKIFNGGTGSWVMYDNKRNTFNVVNSALFPDLTNAEETADNGFECEVDMLSNGFKLRGSGNAYWMNQSGWNYLYMAFAEHPLVASNGIPATAR
jgi:hypothetical protein